MELNTTYLGMRLRSPLVVSASPLTENLENIKRAEESGAAAVVLYSLFEEQLHKKQRELWPIGEETMLVSEGPGTDYFPRQSRYARSPESYLEHIRVAKEAVNIPIIASLNASSIGGWTEYAKQMQQAGADALELNIYYIPTETHVTGAQVERTYLEIVEAVRSVVTIPMGVKLGPYFSNMANMAGRFERAGADSLVLFNRFYQPDFNLELMEVKPRLYLSTTEAMRLPLRWIAILYGQVHCDLAGSGGIHTPQDVVKMLMAGASVTMLCSALLKQGLHYISYLEGELARWMEKHDFETVEEMQGLLSQKRVSDPTAFERAHYIRSLQSVKLTPTGIAPRRPRVFTVPGEE
jgi:dihydroorotate dehydrogenase (fumarate)